MERHVSFFEYQPDEAHIASIKGELPRQLDEEHLQHFLQQADSTHASLCKTLNLGMHVGSLKGFEHAAQITARLLDWIHAILDRVDSGTCPHRNVVSTRAQLLRERDRFMQLHYAFHDAIYQTELASIPETPARAVEMSRARFLEVLLGPIRALSQG